MDETNWGYGTGFFLNDDGLILTNKHMVFNEALGQNYQFIKVRKGSETDYVDAEIVSISPDCDLATIKCNKKSNYFNTIGEATVGETVFTIGNPNGFGLSFTKGNVSSNTRNVIYNEKTIKALQTSFVINEGNSGGPVFNKDGKLVGIISFRLKDKNGDVIQGVSFAIPSEQIKQFLNL